ncbi:MAG: hypothetical protein RIR70_1880, partial [Pseudomonadota bacterium]
MNDKKPLRIIRRAPAMERVASGAARSQRDIAPGAGVQIFFATCPRGLEPLLAEDLAALGGSDIRPVAGGVHFKGDWRACYRANLESRIAARVLWCVGEGRYRTEEDIYALARRITWMSWFSQHQTMRVYVTAKRCPLKSLEFITLRIKDAVCDRFRDECGERPSIDTESPDVRIHAYLTEADATFYVDTSGEPLYIRGMKHAKVGAPIKENLAAGILRLAGWQPGQTLLDPMCGSGTFLIEAAQMALDIAAVNRQRQRRVGPRRSRHAKQPPQRQIHH